MVERGGPDADPAHVPSIAELLAQYKDRTGASYEDMARSIGEAVSGGRLHQLATKPQRNFPDPETIRHLSDLLHVSVTTVLEAFAVSFGLRVEDRPLLALTLPPGTDVLTDRDRAAILAVIRQFVEARRPAPDPTPPDLATVEGLRLAEDVNDDANRPTGK